MEILEPNHESLQQIKPAWEEWLIFDRRPRIVERGIDFTQDVSTIKRHLFTEAAQRNLDVTAKVLHGERLMFQVFTLDGAFPQLPTPSDARKKHPWSEWLDGNEHTIVTERASDATSLRAYIYKQAKARGLKAHVSFIAGGLKVLAYKESER